MRGIHRWPVNSPHKGPVTRKMFPFDGRHHEQGSHKRFPTHVEQYPLKSLILLNIFWYPGCWMFWKVLTYWGRVTHICVSKLTIIGSDNGLSPDRRQAIIWTNDGLLLIGSLGTNFSEILIEILTFSFKKMRLKVSSAKRRPFCLGLNVLKCWNAVA